MAPEGCSSYYVLSPVPHLGHADIDWNDVGPKYTKKILDYLEAHAIPNLNRDLTVLKTLTPFGFRDEMNSHWSRWSGESDSRRYIRRFCPDIKEINAQFFYVKRGENYASIAG